MMDWQKKKLGELCNIELGKTPYRKDKSFWDKEKKTENVWLSIADLLNADGAVVSDSKEYISDKAAGISKVVKEGTLLVSFKLTLGRLAFAGRDLFTNEAIASLTIKNEKEIDKYFLYKYLSFFDWDKAAEGDVKVKGKTLNKAKLKEIEVLFPKSLPEQQRIVSILDQAFAAIDKAKANAEQNLQNAKELFESYLQGVFSEVFDSNERRTIKELAKVIGGYSFKSKDFKKEGQYQVIRMGNVRPGIIRENENPVFINDLDEKVLSKALLQPDDVIITQTGTKKKRDYGFTVIIEKDNYLLNQRIAAIRFNELYLPKFFLYFSWTDLFKDQYFANETGTVGQGNVGIKAITDAEVPFLSLERQERIIENIERIHSETQSLEAIYQKKMHDLEELKKSFLQKAFAGELETENSASSVPAEYEINDTLRKAAEPTNTQL
jgi:type I restriction enzyme S subunit